MITTLYSTKRLAFILLLLCLVLECYWPYTLYSLLYIIQLGVLSLWGLLALNLLVLYVYVKYFVSPTRIGNDSRNKIDLEDFRPLRFTQQLAWSRLEEQRRKENKRTPQRLCTSDAISDSFDELLSYVIRDFIQSWFSNVSTPQELSFPLSVDHIIRSAAATLKRRLEQVDLMSVLLNRLVPRITAHISEFRAAEVALRGRFLERSVTESDELDMLLASHYSGGKLHPALTTAAVTTQPTEVAYLRQLMDRLLPRLLEPDQINCAPVRVIVREVATCALLQPIMNMLSDPDFWNQTIDTQLGMALREQKMVRQLREVLDRHSNDIDTLNDFVETDPSNLLNPPSFSSTYSKQRKMGPISQFSSAFLGIEMDDDVAWDDHDFDPENPKKRQNFSRMGRRTFQEFLRMIDEEKNLLDLKRVRNDVVTQIRKKKALILDRDPEEVVDGEKVEDLIVYVNRLGVAKKRVDKRIATLSGEHVDFKLSASQFFGVRKQRPNQLPAISGFTLHDILTNTAGLSYFMEFMDRRGDMVKLQFWLIVEGFRSSDNDGTKRDDHTFLQDVKMVYEMYFAATSPHRLTITEHLNKDLLQSIQHSQQVIQENDNLQRDQAMEEMRQQLYRIQQHLLWQLEKEHFPYFKRSDLYFKFLASSPTPDTSTGKRNLGDSASSYRRTSSVGQKSHHRQHDYQHPAAPRPSSHSSSSSSSYNRLLRENGNDSSNINHNKADDGNSDGNKDSNNRSNIDDTIDNSLSPSLPVIGMERSSSARMTNKRVPWARRDSGQKAGSDTEINPREKKRPSITVSGQDSISGTSRQSHARTYSDNIATSNQGGASKFLSFGRVFDSANEWWQAADFIGISHQQQQLSKVASMKRNSVHGSLKSTDTEYPDTDEDLSHSVTTLDDDQHATPPHSRQLIRRNTVAAVEAELQSIIDGKESNTMKQATADHLPPITCSSPSSSSSTLSSPSPLPLNSRPNSFSTSSSSHRPPTVLLGGPGVNVKAAMADPIEIADSTATWKSSGEMTTAIAQVIHGQLQPSLHGSENNENERDTLATTDTHNDDNSNTISNVHLAPPGDLMLASKVNKLSEEMEKLLQQEAIVDALIRKAEAKEKTEELRILLISKNMFRRELEQMQYQRSQYELQESENVLTPDRTKVSITNSTIGSDQQGDFALYVIEIQQVGLDGNYASGWIVARRYSEFFGLHQTLKAAYASVKSIDFPSKWPLLKLQKSFVEARRINLERYLKRLLEQPDICQSEALRVFLSQQNIYVPGPQRSSPSASLYQETFISPLGLFPFIPQTVHSDASKIAIVPQPSSSSSSITSFTSPTAFRQLHRSASDKLMNGSVSLGDRKSKGFMRHIYNTVAAGIDDMFVTPSMLDLITQRLGEQVMDFSNDGNEARQRTSASSSSSITPPNSRRYYGKLGTSTTIDDEMSSCDLADESMEAATTTASLGSELKSVDTEGMTRFTEPLCDLFIEMFELKEKNNWLRRQAVVIILQQILGGTIERKLRDTVKYLETETMVVFYFRKIMDSLWPNGAKLTFKAPRRADEKLHTKDEANRKLSTWLPDLLGNMVGRQNARKGARRLFSVLQNQRLNQHLAYVLLDEIVMALFPDLDDRPLATWHA